MQLSVVNVGLVFLYLQSGFTSLVCPSVLKSDIGKTGETWWSDIKVDLRQFLMCLSGENGVVWEAH